MADEFYKELVEGERTLRNNLGWSGTEPSAANFYQELTGLKTQIAGLWDLSAIANGQVPYWNSTTKKFVPGDFALASHTHSNATTSVAGYMSAADKTKLDGVATGATANTGTVTSVALSLPSAIFSVSGSPITTSGTISASLASASANQFLAGPASGGAAALSLRAIVEADIPSLDASKIGAGTLAIARGGTGGGTQAAAINNLLPSQTGNSGKVLTTDGTDVSWGTSNTGLSLTSITLSSSMVTAGNWAGTTPTDLANVVDSSDTTVTGWGQTAGGGNKGWILVDLGSVYSNLFFKCKIGFRMGDGWGGGSANWYIEVADDAGNYTPLWYVASFKPGTTEYILNTSFWTRAQKIRFAGEDSGNGPAILRVYDFKAWSVTLP